MVECSCDVAISGLVVEEFGFEGSVLESFI